MTRFAKNRLLRLVVGKTAPAAQLLVHLATLTVAFALQSPRLLNDCSKKKLKYYLSRPHVWANGPIPMESGREIF